MEKLIILSLLGLTAALALSGPAEAAEIKLPQPETVGETSVEEALRARRTNRSFSGEVLTLKEMSQILWAAYGVTARRGAFGFRTAPSAGALYPLDVYVAVGHQTVGGLEAGVYHYGPEEHSIVPVKSGDRREDLGRAALGQSWLSAAPAVIVITGEYARMTVKYGDRGRGYVLMESGCAAQNVFLQAEALGLKAGIIGAFIDPDVAKVLNLPDRHAPLLIMPVGHAKQMD